MGKFENREGFLFGGFAPCVLDEGIKFWIYWALGANDLRCHVRGLFIWSVNASVFPQGAQVECKCRTRQQLERSICSVDCYRRGLKKTTIDGNQLESGFQFLFMRITSIVFDWAVASSLSIYDFTRLFINSIVKPHHPYKAGLSDKKTKQEKPLPKSSCNPSWS